MVELLGGLVWRLFAPVNQTRARFRLFGMPRNSLPFGGVSQTLLTENNCLMCYMYRTSASWSIGT